MTRSFQIPPGAIVGVIGPNGAGKSTLFRMIAGREKPDQGEIIIGSTVQLAIVDQTRESLPDDKTVFDAISGGQDILTVGKFEMPSRAYLGRFNFKGGDQQKIVGQLSGGRTWAVALLPLRCCVAATSCCSDNRRMTWTSNPRALEDALLEFAGSARSIPHDRWFLDWIATHIMAFEGDSKVVFFEGNYQEFEADKKKRLSEDAARSRPIRYKALMA